MSNPHLEQPSPNIPSIYPQAPQGHNRPQYPAPPPNYQNQPPSYSPLPQQYSQQPYPQQQYQQNYPQQNYPQQNYQHPQQNYPQQNYPQQNYQPPPPSYGAVQPPNSTQPPQIELCSVTNLKTDSETVQCPHCNQFVATTLDYNMGLMTGASMVVMYLFGCHSGGCLIPVLIPGLKDVGHKCPNCSQLIATFERMERQTRVHAPAANL